MRFVSFSADGVDRLGIEVDGQIGDLSGHREKFPDMLSLLHAGKRARLEELTASLPCYSSDEVRYFPPISAGAKIFCVGINYRKKHPVVGEVTERPPHPTIFVKTVEALVGHGEEIEYPAGLSEQLDYEGELAVVIGTGGRRIALGDALSHVVGYTILNDGSVRDWQKVSLYTGKNFFHASACGPAIVTADVVGDPLDLTLRTCVNGEEVQNTNTGQMMFNIAEIISHLSKFTMLSPGDIIATGSPGGSGGSMVPQRWLKPGDRVEIEIDKIGMLSNVVR